MSAPTFDDLVAIVRTVKYATISPYSVNPDARYMLCPCDPWAVGECQPFPSEAAAKDWAEARGWIIIGDKVRGS